MREVTGDVTSDAVPHRDGGDIGELADKLLVTLEIGAENTGVLVDEFYGHSLDVCGSDSSHIFHRVKPIMGMPYLRLTLTRIQQMENDSECSVGPAVKLASKLKRWSVYRIVTTQTNKQTDGLDCQSE